MALVIYNSCPENVHVGYGTAELVVPGGNENELEGQSLLYSQVSARGHFMSSKPTGDVLGSGQKAEAG